MNRKTSLVWIAVLSIVLLNVGGARVAGALTASPRSLVSIPGHRTTEFSAAQDPLNAAHLVAGGIDWDTWRGTWTCAAFVSWDAGNTWRGSVVAPLNDYALQGDPWVSFGADGTVHYTCLALRVDDVGGARLLYARSTDGGTTWSAPAAIAPRTPADHVDRTGIIARGHTVIACVNEYQYPPGDPNPYATAVFDGIAIARSTDDGVTWAPTKQIFTTYAGCRGAATAPDGSIYVSFVGTLPDGSAHAGTIHSSDDGVTWTAPTWVDNLPEDDLGHVYYGGVITVSQQTGSVFLARPGAKPRLFRSTDRGATYDPITLPDIPTTCSTCTGINRTLVTSNAKGDIALEVEIGDLNDVRAQAMYITSVNKEEWLLVSHDDGATWLPPLRVAAMDATNSFVNPKTFAPSQDGATGDVNGINRNPTDASANFWATAGPIERSDHLINGGDYTGMSTSGNDFVVMWVGHYNGIPQIWASKVSE